MKDANRNVTRMPNARILSIAQVPRGAERLMLQSQSDPSKKKIQLNSLTVMPFSEVVNN